MSSDIEGVTRAFLRTRNRFSTDPSLTFPSFVRKIASSYPARAASMAARREFTYAPLIFAAGGIIVLDTRVHEETMQEMTFFPKYDPRGTVRSTHLVRWVWG